MGKMLILPGRPGRYPDEKGEVRDWPDGAIHWEPASEYAKLKKYEPVRVKSPGIARGDWFERPQVKETVKLFREDVGVVAFYGFSGGGYNLLPVLTQLAKENPRDIWRIELVVVLGAADYPDKINRASYRPSNFSSHVPEGVTRPSWRVVYRGNPGKKDVALPPKVDSTHMFGPEWLLKLAQEGKDEG